MGRAGSTLEEQVLDKAAFDCRSSYESTMSVVRCEELLYSVEQAIVLQASVKTMLSWSGRTHNGVLLHPYRVMSGKKRLLAFLSTRVILSIWATTLLCS